MTKKILSLFVVAPLLLVGLVGCGDEGTIEAPGKSAVDETKGLVTQMNEQTDKYNESFG